MLALRDRDWTGRAAGAAHLGVARSGGSAVVGSLTALPLDATPRLGLVPYGEGMLTLPRGAQRTRAVTVTHVFRGRPLTNEVEVAGSVLRLPYAERTGTGEAVEWIEVELAP